MHTPSPIAANPRTRGFTMTELMVALAVFGLVLSSTIPTFIMCNRSWALTSVQLRAAQTCSAAIERLVYGVGAQYGLRSAMASTVVVTPNGTGWHVEYRDIMGMSNSFTYSPGTRELGYEGPDTVGKVVVGRNITSATVSNTPDWLTISVTAGMTEGRYSASNTMTSLVTYRNQ